MSSPFKRPTVWMPLIIATSLVVGLLIGSQFASHSPSAPSLSKLATIMELIEAEYVDDINGDSLIEETIPDLLSKLDPHTAYIPAADLQSVNDELEGSFSGIGISFNMLTDTITVLEVISGGPSEKVGLLPGDRIVAIDDSVAAGKKWSQERVLNTLRGPKRTVVKLGIKRTNSPELLTYEVTRGDIPVTSVDATYLLTPEIGYVKINKFGRHTYMEFLTSMATLKAAGAQSYIIDLRSNGGGFLEPAVMMANEFLQPALQIVSTHGRLDSTESFFASDGLGSFKDEPVVVLIDEYSASASEIFSGALQDNDRGLIVGRRSFGKGLVQRQIDLPDSSAIRLTTARYYTPSGRCIQKSYTPGAASTYSMEIEERYIHGEGYNEDSVKLDKSHIFYTAGGREVYGGGGIMPDVYVATDTTGFSSYYFNVSNAGLLHRYSFTYTDLNREQLNAAADVDELLEMLPDDDVLLYSFVDYAKREAGIPIRWGLVNVSQNLLLRQIKALIARDVLGTSAYYEVYNRTDPTVQRAIEEINQGAAAAPISKGLKAEGESKNNSLSHLLKSKDYNYLFFTA
ncbi:MAG: S41 family peptidase [Bacteroidales bacterium]|nr:S41 family peptidase [Bacteroidales bacterium]